MFHAQQVTILGVGLIGGSLGLALKERGLASRAVGVARRSETLETARRIGAIDEGTHDVSEAVRDADLVVLATPVRTALQQLSEIGPHLKPGCLVTDVCSTKAEIVHAARCHLPSGICFIGGHPLAGSEKSGPAAARAHLFQDATWVLTPNSEFCERALESARALVTSVGARVLELSAESHDELVAATSHLPHLLAVALIKLVAKETVENPELPQLMAGGFRDLTRIAAGDPTMWQDICATNRQAILAWFEKLSDELAALVQALSDTDETALHALLSRAAEFRRKL